MLAARTAENIEKSRKNKIAGYVYRLIGTQEADIPLCTTQEFRSVIGLDRPQSTLEFLKDNSPLPLSEEERLFALDVFQREWKTVRRTDAETTRANALQRQNQLPPLELLEVKQKGSPAIKTALARAYIGGWFRSTSEPIVTSAGNEKAFDRAIELITIAAQNGEPEACFLMATLKRPLPNAQIDNLADALPKNPEKIQKRFKQEFVLLDERERLNYLSYSASRGFIPAREKLREDQHMAECAFDYDNSRSDFDCCDPEEHEFFSERARDLLRQADQGDAVSQRKIGVAILESDESIVYFLSSSQTKATPAKYWLELAAGAGDLEAKFYLATRFEKGEKKIDLLRSLITSKLPSYLKAVCCLELGKIYADDTSHVVNHDLAKKLFGFALGLDGDNRNARFALADLTLLNANATQDELRAALDFFDSQKDDPEALFRSGLMRLRGQGCLANRDASKEFFEKVLFVPPSAPQRNYISLNFSAEDTPIHITVIESWARMVLALGWGGLAEWKRVARQTILDEISKGINDKNISPITENDVCALLDQNPEYEKYREFLNLTQVLHGKKNKRAAEVMVLLAENGHLSATSEWDANPAGKDLLADGEYFGFADMKVFFQGLLYCLRERSLVDIEVLDQYWHDNFSLAESFSKGCLYAFGRFGIDRVVDSVEHFERAIEISEMAKNAPDRGPLFDQKFALQMQSYSRDKLMSIQLELRNKELEKTNDELIKKSLALDYTNKELINTKAELEDMMAMFAHKFRGPVDSIISNAEHHLENRDHLFKDLGRTMNGLLDIFSFVSSHSEKLMPRLEEDSEGPHTLPHVLHKALWLTVVQLLTKRNIDRMNKHYFMYAIKERRIPADTIFSEWRKEKSMRDIREAIRSTWEMEIGAYGDFSDLDGLLTWLSSKLMLIQVKGISAQGIRFSDSGVKESLLLIIFTEILVNAIKHYETSSERPVLICWRMNEGKAVFSCENPTSELARKRGEGSGRGLKFLSMIARNVGGEFYPPSEADNALAEFSFPIKLFK